jgi:hypothetical protein
MCTMLQIFTYTLTKTLSVKFITFNLLTKFREIIVTKFREIIVTKFREINFNFAINFVFRINRRSRAS